jgi:hypothetical protein
MPQPVKLSDALIDAARAESARADRSLAGQIEHWAQLGRMIEPSLTSAKTQALKHAEIPLMAALPPAEEGRALLEALTAALTSDASRSRVTRGFAGRVRYGTDPDRPGIVIRLEPDGTRTVGRLINGRFEAEHTTTDPTHALHV